jgi:hypothetical protein
MWSILLQWRKADWQDYLIQFSMQVDEHLSENSYLITTGLIWTYFHSGEVMTKPGAGTPPAQKSF